MDDQNKNPLNFEDDKISEIQKKIAGNQGEKPRSIFEKALTQTPPGGLVSDAIPESFVPKKDTAQNITSPVLPTLKATPVAIKPPIQDRAQPNQDKVVIKSLRTFQGDVADIIKDQNASMLSITMAERRKKEAVEKAPEKNVAVMAPIKVKPPVNHEIKKNIMLVTASLVLVLLGVGAVVGFYILQKDSDSPTTVNQTDNQILGFNSKIEINTTVANKNRLIETFSEKKDNLALSVGEIAYVSLINDLSGTNKKISTQDFLKILETNAPAALSRSFDEAFMLGLYKVDKNETFILIKLNAFDLAFDGMLNWEEKMYEDIGKLFTKQNTSEIATAPDPSTSSSTLTASPNLNSLSSPRKAFEDEVIKNKDTRVLKNERGETLLIYSFLNRDVLLITSNERVLQELISKLLAQKLIR